MAWRLLALVLAVYVYTPGDALARVRAGPSVTDSSGHRLRAVAGAAEGTGGSAAAAYSLRQVKAAYAGPAIRLRRASDNAELDINFLGWTSFTGAPWDEAAAVAHCAATSCTVRAWYDQSGNGRHAQQAAAASQPALVFSCRGTLPCLSFTTAAMQLYGPVLTPATGVVSASVVASRLAGTGYCRLVGLNGANQMLNTASAVANTWWWQASAGSTTINTTALDGAWHSFQGVVNGASSYTYLDGVAATGSMTGNTVAATTQVLGSSSGAADCRQTEVAIWDNYALTAAERVSLTNNQRAYWGF